MWEYYFYWQERTPKMLPTEQWELPDNWMDIMEEDDETKRNL